MDYENEYGDYEHYSDQDEVFVNLVGDNLEEEHQEVEISIPDERYVVEDPGFKERQFRVTEQELRMGYTGLEDADADDELIIRKKKWQISIETIESLITKIYRVRPDTHDKISNIMNAVYQIQHDKLESYQPILLGLGLQFWEEHNDLNASNYEKWYKRIAHREDIEDSFSTSKIEKQDLLRYVLILKPDDHGKLYVNVTSVY